MPADERTTDEAEAADLEAGVDEPADVEAAEAAGSPPEVAGGDAGASPAGEDPMDGEAPSG